MSRRTIGQADPEPTPSGEPLPFPCPRCRRGRGDLEATCPGCQWRPDQPLDPAVYWRLAAERRANWPRLVRGYLRGVHSRRVAYVFLGGLLIVMTYLAIAATFNPAMWFLFALCLQGAVGLGLSILWVERNDPWR